MKFLQHVVYWMKKRSVSGDEETAEMEDDDNVELKRGSKLSATSEDNSPP